MKIQRIGAAALLSALVLGAASCESCGNPCEQGQFQEKVGYDDGLEVRRIPLEPRSSYCEVSRAGVIEWVKMSSSRLDYTFDATYLGPPEVDENGVTSYSVEPQSLVERTSRAYDVWLDCGAAERDETPGNEKPMLQYLDLNAARNVRGSTYEIPAISWPVAGAARIGEALSPYETRGSRTLPFSGKSYSLCVSSGALRGTLLVKDYIPLYECRSAPPPPPSPPPAPVACNRPDPPATVKTCSGEETQNPSFFTVGVVDGASGCGMVIQELATSEEEAKKCAGAIPGATVVDELCYYSVRIYDDPPYFVTKIADSEENAVECAKNTECSGDYGVCTLDEVSEVDCASF